MIEEVAADILAAADECCASDDPDVLTPDVVCLLWIAMSDADGLWNSCCGICFDGECCRTVSS